MLKGEELPSDRHHLRPLNKWACPELHSRVHPSLPPEVVLLIPEVSEAAVASTCSRALRQHSEVCGCEGVWVGVRVRVRVCGCGGWGV